ncbi:hypothetical protein [Rhodoplanes azumiensis]|uniref:Uncharacterized protein n=1 Tax=Rhodoplanes azumiensis TaxID=1897628 RepID=A0ABW5APS9_9BRAD
MRHRAEAAAARDDAYMPAPGSGVNTLGTISFDFVHPLGQIIEFRNGEAGRSVERAAGLDFSASPGRSTTAAAATGRTARRVFDQAGFSAEIM